MASNADLPSYDGPPLSSASHAVQLLERFQAGSITGSLADTIDSRVDKHGLNSLTATEAHFVALEIYHRAVFFDGFASLFYNKATYISVMLEATTRTGANTAHKLIVEGLKALGLTEAASVDAIEANSERLSAAISGEDESVEADKLAGTFDALSEMFDKDVTSLLPELLALLRSNTAEFQNFA